MPCRPGPCKTWQEETMFSAVRAVLKLGMPLINVSRRFGIPYPTLFYYTNRVRQLLKPCESDGSGRPTFGYSRPPGKRGRPTKVYLGTWRDEDLTRAILRVVYKDYIPDSIETLLGASSSREEIELQWPASSRVSCTSLDDKATTMDLGDEDSFGEQVDIIPIPPLPRQPSEEDSQDDPAQNVADGTVSQSEATAVACPTSSTDTVAMESGGGPVHDIKTNSDFTGDP